MGEHRDLKTTTGAHREQFWKWIAAVLMTALLAGTTGLSLRGSEMSREEVRRMIHAESPYREERLLLLDKISKLERSMETMNERLDKVLQQRN